MWCTTNSPSDNDPTSHESHPTAAGIIGTLAVVLLVLYYKKRKRNVTIDNDSIESLKEKKLLRRFWYTALIIIASIAITFIYSYIGICGSVIIIFICGSAIIFILAIVIVVLPHQYFNPNFSLPFITHFPATGAHYNIRRYGWLRKLFRLFMASCLWYNFALCPNNKELCAQSLEACGLYADVNQLICVYGDVQPFGKGNSGAHEDDRKWINNGAKTSNTYKAWKNRRKQFAVLFVAVECYLR
eukprot:848551_1